MPGNCSTERGEVAGEVLIVGAGPVGLTLALALGRAGIGVVLMERREDLRETSRAIGITPASLEIFQRYGMAEELASRGVRVRDAVIHGDRGEIARLSFRSLPSDFPFILSLPQRRTEEVLLSAVEREPSVRLLRGWTVMGYDIEGEGVRVRGVDAAFPRGPEVTARGRFLVGCDGKHSTIRRAAGAAWSGRELKDTFVMADIEDGTSLREAAHLWFTSHGSVESFPLPGGIRRWIVQTATYQEKPPGGVVQRVVASRTALSLDGSRELWRSSFRTERRIASSWAQPPVFLAGDAAHLMPPIGGQGMNVGLGDAEHLADLLALAVEKPIRLAELSRLYEKRRRRAFRVASRRSILGMKIGTGEGWLSSRLREALIPAAVSGRRGERVMEHFAMLASPNRRSPWM